MVHRWPTAGAPKLHVSPTRWHHVVVCGAAAGLTLSVALALFLSALASPRHMLYHNQNRLPGLLLDRTFVSPLHELRHTLGAPRTASVDHNMPKFHGQEGPGSREKGMASQYDKAATMLPGLLPQEDSAGRATATHHSLRLHHQLALSLLAATVMSDRIPVLQSMKFKHEHAQGSAPGVAGVGSSPPFGVLGGRQQQQSGCSKDEELRETLKACQQLQAAHDRALRLLYSGRPSRTSSLLLTRTQQALQGHCGLSSDRVNAKAFFRIREQELQARCGCGGAHRGQPPMSSADQTSSGTAG